MYSTFEELSPELASALIERLTRTQEARRRQRLFYRLFPDQDTVEPDGSKLYARHRYAKHLEFFEAGAEYRERCAMCDNRVGKTLGMGGYETACHLVYRRVSCMVARLALRWPGALVGGRQDQRNVTRRGPGDAPR